MEIEFEGHASVSTTPILCGHVACTVSVNFSGPGEGHSFSTLQGVLKMAPFFCLFVFFCFYISYES